MNKEENRNISKHEDVNNLKILFANNTLKFYSKRERVLQVYLIVKLDREIIYLTIRSQKIII